MKKRLKSWPKIDPKLILKEKIQLAIQINGKTREVIEVEKDIIKLQLKKFVETMKR